MNWHGVLPERWETHKISELFAERREKVSDTDFAPLSVSKGGIVPQIATVAKSNAGDNRKLVRKGDFAINSRSDRRGSSGVSQYDGSVSLINIVLTPRSETNGKYWHYLLKSHNFIEEYYRNGRGIVADLWTTRLSEMKTIYLPLPPRDEQDQIVRYLDWKVSGINRLINAKRRQIALLGEQKQAIIDKTIVSTKAETIRLKYVANVFIGLTYSPADLTNENMGTAVLRANNIQNGKLVWDNMAYVKCNVPEKLLLRKGDILVCSRNGSRSLIGKCGKVTNEFSGKTFGAFNTVVRSEHSEYLYYIFHSQFFTTQAGAYSTSTINQLTLGMFNAMSFPFPSKEKQESTILFLDEQCANIDKIIEKLNNEISLFAEYRTRLISDIVTGKIDVRGVVVPEFEAVDDVAGDGEADDVEEMDVI